MKYLLKTPIQNLNLNAWQMLQKFDWNDNFRKTKNYDFGSLGSWLPPCQPQVAYGSRPITANHFEYVARNSSVTINWIIARLKGLCVACINDCNYYSAIKPSPSDWLRPPFSLCHSKPRKPQITELNWGRQFSVGAIVSSACRINQCLTRYSVAHLVVD